MPQTKQLTSELREKYRTILSEREGKMPNHTWICYACGRQYPNTLLICPYDNIARKHSQNLWKNDRWHRKYE